MSTKVHSKTDRISINKILTLIKKLHDEKVERERRITEYFAATPIVYNIPDKPPYQPRGPQ